MAATKDRVASAFGRNERHGIASAFGCGTHEALGMAEPDVDERDGVVECGELVDALDHLARRDLQRVGTAEKRSEKRSAQRAQQGSPRTHAHTRARACTAQQLFRNSAHTQPQFRPPRYPPRAAPISPFPAIRPGGVRHFARPALRNHPRAAKVVLLLREQGARARTWPMSR